MSSKIPARYRLTLKHQNEPVKNADGSYLMKESKYGPVHVYQPSTPLAFANVYDPENKAYAKRAITQNDWAYKTCYEKDGKLWWKGRRWETRGKKHEVFDYDEPIPDNLQPRIIDNIPLEGYRIKHSVSRCSTSNKLWRILDPRGFELEINTGTMEDLIMSGTIEKGLIIGPCIWQTAKMLVRV